MRKITLANAHMMPALLATLCAILCAAMWSMMSPQALSLTSAGATTGAEHVSIDRTIRMRHKPQHATWPTVFATSCAPLHDYVLSHLECSLQHTLCSTAHTQLRRTIVHRSQATHTMQQQLNNSAHLQAESKVY